MMFQSKLDRAMEWVKNRNRKSDNDKINGELEEDDLIEQWDEENQDIKLDKIDILALIISALLVFLPIIIILLFIAYLVTLIQ